MFYNFGLCVCVHKCILYWCVLNLKPVVVLLFNRLYFLEFTAKLSGRHRNFSFIHCQHTCMYRIYFNKMILNSDSRYQIIGQGNREDTCGIWCMVLGTLGFRFQGYNISPGTYHSSFIEPKLYFD